jgi:Tol biopolymer transport system component
MGALGLAVVIATGFAMQSRSAPASPAARSVAFSLDLAPAEMLGPAGRLNRPSRTGFAISPDGTTIVYAGSSTSGTTQTTMLYRRPLSDPQATPIPGTEGAEYPFFSPDAKWIGFCAGNKLKKVALDGGPPIDISNLPLGPFGGASWASGVIVFGVAGLWSVADSGSKPPEMLLKIHGENLYSPAFLPDGGTVLFTQGSDVDSINIETKVRNKVMTNGADARYVSSGHLVFLRNGTLLAVPFDTKSVYGAAVPLVASVMQSVNTLNGNNETKMGQYAVSSNGTLVYASGGIYPTGTTTVVQVDRNRMKETALAVIRGVFFGLRVSPDGKRFAGFNVGESRGSDIWQFTLPGATPARITYTGSAWWPLWAPDQSITILTSQTAIHSLPLKGGALQPLIAQETGRMTHLSWSADGKWLAYRKLDPGPSQIFIQAMRDGKPDSGEPRQFSPSSYSQTHAEFSPNGHWLAYVTDETGADEVYIQPFPGPGEKQRISRDGGRDPAWARNSREIYYLKPKRGSDNETETRHSLMAVNISSSGEPSGHRELFEGRYVTSTPLRSYDLTPEGHFIMMRIGDPPDQRVTKLNVVLGWGEELKRRVPLGSGSASPPAKP